ncbi:MAG: hypothetical protein IJ005_08040 [Bacteroidales bacterium]|nr:hypothetical protein [Bacteroidales bacterium]
MTKKITDNQRVPENYAAPSLRIIGIESESIFCASGDNDINGHNTGAIWNTEGDPMSFEW